MKTLLAAICLGVICIGAQTPRFSDAARRDHLATAFPEIDALMERWQKQRGAPGLVYGIVIDGELAHLKAFGIRNVETRDPVTARTVFRIASMTKSFTALALLKLRDAGKLSLEDPVSKWIPEFSKMPLSTSDSPPLRVRQLVTHTAGFPEDNPWGDRQLHISEGKLDEWLRAGIPISTPPGTAFEYSNYGFALAGRVIAGASGVSYRDYLEKEILAPLGMKASTLEASAVPGDVLAMGYRRNPSGGYQPDPPLAHGAFGAMGGLLTSSEDLARWVAFQLSAWPARDEPESGPVRRSSVREMQQMWSQNQLVARSATSTSPLAVSVSGYGYGLGISRDCRFRHIVGHGGGLPGYGSYMVWLPEYGVGLFAMSNLTYAGPASALSEAFDVLRRTGALKPRALPAAPVLTSTRDQIFDLWRKWDTSKARKLAADNLFLDTSEAERRARVERLKHRAGQCRDVTEVEPENLLRGAFRINCEHGPVHVRFTLAPTQPPAVQFLDFSEQPSQSDNICRPE